ncbi:uncharacterized protein N7482_002542 [Penicillium canariense]|uniref:SRR1-like domain-containing protein n=1 Tax=Penicillium canariense TaxID=189055 RepID=A0A9W9IIZ1_9EURO|nr:uncharacterized protein N7482_002542 [Penicillium canariense]KAJ5176665.1 hypothetical protein N7482_002542 [Penicillium canariense]
MPHTSRKKRAPAPAQKRLQVTDDDGWTHVTSSTNVRRVIRGTRKGSEQVSQPSAQGDQDSNAEREAEGEAELVLGPAEAPGRLTLAELQAQYRGHRERWEGSKTWAQLKGQLVEQIADRGIGPGASRQSGMDEGPVRGPVDAIVCVGLGSPSGFLRGGWVDRRSVSMYQLAALECIAERLSRSCCPSPFLRFSPTTNQTTSTGPDNSLPLSFPIYAQDPVFNTLDTALLASLGITVVAHPAAFSLITPRTLLFCPGAERKHLEQLLPSDPCMVFGGPLENTESEVIQGFAGQVGSCALVPFEANEHAFWQTRLYYRARVEVNVGVEA